MEAVLVALIAAISAISVSLIEISRRKNNSQWAENKADHNFVVEKIDAMGKSLGISIDRVEKGVERTEEKVDQHIRDHARGDV